MKFTRLKEYGFVLNSNDELEDFNQKAMDGLTPLFFCLERNTGVYQLNYNKEHFNYLIEHSDKLYQDDEGFNFLNMIAVYNLDENLNFSANEILKILKDNPALLKQETKNGWKLINHLLYHNYDQNLNFTKKEALELINLDLEQIKVVNYVFFWSPINYIFL